MSNKYDFRILIVDDNPEIHHDFIKILTNVKKNNNVDKVEAKLFSEENSDALLPEFLIDTATQGQQGVEKVAEALKENKPYALAFVDIRMPPGWDGVETIKHIWEIDKEIQIVICTAYSDYTWEETISKLGKSDNLLILKKPFDFIAIRQLACALTHKWKLLQESNRYKFSLERSVKERTISLQQSLSLLQATLESSTDGILVVDNDNNITDFNKKLIEMWELPENIITGRNFTKLVEFIKKHISSRSDFENEMDTLKKHPDKITLGTLNLRNKKIFEYYSQPQRLNQIIKGRVFSFRDITKRAYLEKELQHQATHDSLTDLPNRILLEEFMEDLINSEQQQSFAVLFLDLDRFKLINDSLGHSAGDELLREIARRLLTVFPKPNLVARLGGDEFVVVLKSIVDRQTIEHTAQHVLSIVNDVMTVSNREVIISGSVGISIYPDHGYKADTLLGNADIAMYKAKKSGASHFAFYTENLNRESLQLLEKEMQLRQAIANGELFLVYQPQVDLPTKSIIAVEALVRWRHPTKGVLLPIDFIPLAEETGLIIPIGEWVLRMACKQNKAWQDSGLKPIRVAVNITTYQLNQYNLVEIVKDILEETRLEPEYLELELTENSIIGSTNVVNTINTLKSFGIHIALDDFGTGYSSLNYLKNIHLDRLKIDRSFVQNILVNRGDEVIIQAIITMARSLNLEVLAEGVETREQLEYLINKNCGEIQGFYFSQPVSDTELESILSNSSDVMKLFPKAKNKDKVP